MKRFLILLFVSQFIILFSQKTYFDEDDKIISEKEFNARQIPFGKLKVCNDSLQECKIIPTRSEDGTIESDRFIIDLGKLLNTKLDTKKPTIITFHPGKDRCNSTGTATSESSYLWHKEKEELADKIKTSNFLYIYKDKTNVKTLKKLQWFKDPKNMIENTFFQYHYPCSSYVIIYNNKYRSYFGEFSKDKVVDDLKTIIK
ncbi:hypothetical protein CHRY9390_01271 [Chryseobacterium aquaeductus]|uniref:Uncharacterized protein n=1 Tax=Chryseobacterium aquaeductus TaxID=2675056 RepID=A0A9N8MFN5_9FLAO|nr:hypothetical protein [Chryseobacterium aquaeductus]CAA7330600.1 hypothetical protein CHRY9390_01271 [Chryseobacterium potabilaquae]CAD7804769.1 hypothetical protein CHRY9390_01271 [Chryseobacterium aquaeductus]